MDKTQSKALDLFLQWVSSEAGYNYCLRVSGTVFRDSFRYSSLAAVSPYPLREPASQEAKQDMQDDISHDFIVFLLDSFADEIKIKQSLVLDLLSGRAHHVVQYGWHNFLNQWKEKARSKKHNPRGYLYRRVREIVGSNDRFAARDRKEGWLAYTVAEKASMCKKIWPGRAALYSSWQTVSMEDSAVPEKEIFRSRFLVAAALDFHGQAVKEFQEECWVPVRELIRFLTVHYPWLNRPVITESLPDNDYLNETNITNSINEDMEDRLERMSLLASISSLAGQVTSCFTLEECRVFYLKLSQPSLTFRKISDQLGYPDHNRAYQMYTRALSKVKRFSSDWPGSPVNELPKKVQIAYMENLQSNCKKRLNCP